MNHSHHCDALILLCMDWRKHGDGLVDKIKSKFGFQKGCDVITGAGSAKRLLDPVKAEDIFDQIEISKKLHNIHTVVLTNHTDCGAYGEAGTEERLLADLKLAKEIMEKRFPDLKVETALVRLDSVEDCWQTSCEPVAA